MSALTATLIDEIKSAPEPMQQELLEYLTCVKSRRADGTEDLLPLAQNAWAADWTTPEENEAWRDL